MTDRYAKIITFWLKNYFRELRHKCIDSTENSRSSSLFLEDNVGVSHPDSLKGLEEGRFSQEEQDILQNMRYKSLLLIAKEGRGKLSLIQSVCNELNLEVISLSH